MNLKSLLNKASGLVMGETPFSFQNHSVQKGGVIGTTIDDILFNLTTRKRLELFGDMLAPYLQNPWVYASIQAIATNIANAPHGLFQKQQDNSGEKREASGSKLAELLRNPSNLLSGSEIMLGTIIFLEGWGEAFWVVRRENASAIPDVIELVHPSQMSPKVDKQRNFLGWEVKTTSGKAVPLMPWEVVHFKLFHPADPLRGLPRWASASMGMEANRNADIFNSKQFDDNAILSGVVKVAGELTSSQFRRLWQQFNAKDSEGELPTRVGILENADKIDFQHIPLNKLDMEFSDLKDSSKEEVFAVYKTNPVVLGIFEDVKSMEGTKTAHATWWSECLIPEINYLTEAINEQFVKWIEPKNEFCWLVEEIEALQDDYDKRLERAEKLWGMGVPFNEINRKLNLGIDEFDWGELGFLDAGKRAVSSLEDAMEIGATPPQLTGEVPSQFQSDDEDEQEDELEPKALNRPKSRLKAIDRETMEQVKQELDQTFDELEKLFERKFKRFVMEARVEVLREIQRLDIGKSMNLKGVESFVFNTLTINTLYKDLIGDAYTEAGLAGINSTETEIIAQYGDTPTTRNMIRTRSIRFAINKFASQRMNSIVPTMIDGIGGNVLGAVRDGVLANETTHEITDRVRKAFNFTQKRALTIARTESGSILNGARHIVHKEAGIGFHEWITAGDDAVRDTHAGQDGEIVRIGEKFSNGLRYPNDPMGAPEEVINCRCVAVAVIDVKN